MVRVTHRFHPLFGRSLAEDVAERVIPHHRLERVHQRARAEQEHRADRVGELRQVFVPVRSGTDIAASAAWP